MPQVLIEVRRDRPESEEVAIIDAVHEALVSAFRIPAEDRHVRLVVHEPHRSAFPPSLAQPDLETLVTVDCLPGRSLDMKRALYAEIVARLEGLGVPRDHVSIHVRESPADNWGVQGGRAASDVGF